MLSNHHISIISEKKQNFQNLKKPKPPTSSLWLPPLQAILLQQPRCCATNKARTTSSWRWQRIAKDLDFLGSQGSWVDWWSWASTTTKKHGELFRAKLEAGKEHDEEICCLYHRCLDQHPCHHNPCSKNPLKYSKIIDGYTDVATTIFL